MPCRCPTPPTLERAYREDYYASEKPTFLAHAGEDQAWAELAQTDRLEIFERLLPPDRRRLLDIGCGPGFFLQTAHARAAGRRMGIEPSRQAAAHARELGATVTEGFFDAESAGALGRFDAVHLNNVLEHVPDPVAICSTLAHGLLDAGRRHLRQCSQRFFAPADRRRAPPRAPTIGGWRRRIISTISISSRLTALLARLGFASAERTTSFPDGSLSDDGRELHRRSGAGPRLPQQAQELRSRVRGRRPERNAARLLSRPGRSRAGPRSRRDRGQADERAPVLHRLVGTLRHRHAAQGAVAPWPAWKCITNIWCRSPSRWRCAAIWVWSSAEDAARVIAETYGAAMRYSDAAHWGDSSNKLSWLIPDLAALFPEARFVHLVRDGRKVASSYFHKLGDECYDDRSTAILQAHYDDADAIPRRRRKRNIGGRCRARASADADAFRGFAQFERICWHWAEINRVILEELSRLPAERTLFVRLEDLRASPCAGARALSTFLIFLTATKPIGVFARPHNVNRPEDRLLDADQRAQFEAIAGDMLARLGYAGRPEYVVNY